MFAVPEKTRNKIKLALSNIDYSLYISMSSDFSISSWWHPAKDATVITYCFDIFLRSWDENDNEIKTKVGEALCKFVPGMDPNTGELTDMLIMADAESEELVNAINAVVNDDGVLQDQYLDYGVGVLYIEKFYIKPEFREHQIGLTVFPIIIQTLGSGIGVVTIIPLPKEDDGIKNIKKEDQRYNSKLSRMVNFLQYFGFQQSSSDNDVWVRPFSCDW